jgi:uncharacterized membrane protein YfcA
MDASLFNPLALALGGMVGLVLALTGAGGGILAVPLLAFGLHLSIMQAAPVGLIAVGTASALGALLGLRERLVRYRAAALIGATGMLMAPLGVTAARFIPNPPLTAAFGLVLAVVAGRMFRQAHRNAQGGDAAMPDTVKWPCVLNPDEGRLIWTLPCAWALTATGAAAGLLSGLLGVGGGFVIVPSLNRYSNLDPRSISATSLAVIALVSVGGVSAAAWQGSIDWDIALPFAAGAVLALLVGRRLAARLAGARLQQAFAVTSAVVAVLLLVRGVAGMAA